MSFGDHLVLVLRFLSPWSVGAGVGNIPQKNLPAPALPGARTTTNPPRRRFTNHRVTPPHLSHVQPGERQSGGAAQAAKRHGRGLHGNRTQSRLQRHVCVVDSTSARSAARPCRHHHGQWCRHWGGCGKAFRTRRRIRRSHRSRSSQVPCCNRVDQQRAHALGTTACARSSWRRHGRSFSSRARSKDD